MPVTDEVRIAELKVMEKALKTKIEFQEKGLATAKAELAEKDDALVQLEAQQESLQGKIASLEKDLKSEKAKSARLSSQARSARAAAGGVSKLPAIDPAKLDLSDAEFSLAGQDRIYVRSLYYAGQEIAVILEYDGNVGARIYGPYYPDDWSIPEESLELGYATMEKRGTDSVVISDIILGNRAYSGVLKHIGGGKLELAYRPRAVKMPVTDEVRIAELKVMETALKTKVKVQDKRLADKTAQIAELESSQSDLEQQVASLEQQLARAKQRSARAPGAVAKPRGIPVVNPDLLDLSRAKMSLAGPNRIYIHSIFYGDQETAVVLEYVGGTEATIYGPYDPKNQWLPEDSLELGYVKLRKAGSDSIEISDIIIGDKAYAGVLKYVGGATLMLAGSPMVVAMPETDEARIAELEQKKSQLSRQVSDLKRDLARATVEPEEAPVAAAAEPVTKPEKSILAGFGGGKALYGSWKATATGLTQSDKQNKFAKYMLPVSQRGTETVYRFRADTAKNDWIGFGLHFFASGDETGNGYGFGSSFLVWLTRDPNYYKSERTYLQLYRSSDDVKMVQMASVGIPEGIAAAVDVEIVYSQAKKTVEVLVNGNSRLEYHVDGVITRGDKIALRTLGGPVEFSRLIVATR